MRCATSPTCRTPPVPLPPPRSDQETDDARIARERYESAKDIVAAIYSKGRHRKWAKAIRQHQLGAATRKAQLWENLDPQLWENLDPAFYAAVKYAGGNPGTAATVGVPGDEKPDRDDILGRLLAKLEKIGSFIKTQRLGGVPAVLPKRNRKRLT
ncbi:hypothetical protein CYMTET_4843 [Cymbomonas tetramitiformis]|uniref:Uncharacterized protein n=1 Tax=Cymbomonas tetramitiformis TaxID=36881 RepID=A0AAE0H299_9CHLO|nr:hypothetical protein CYMTET_4843 [Cymbomonas tetramitiformis]